MKPFRLRVCIIQVVFWSESIFVLYAETAF